MVEQVGRNKARIRRVASADAWLKARQDYEFSGKSANAIAKDINVPRHQVLKRINIEGWSEYRAPPSVDVLADRMLCLLGLQSQRLEARMKENKDGDNAEKDAALLGTMARTLDKLIDIKRQGSAKKEKGHTYEDMEALRERLKQRIRQLKQR